MQASCVTVAYPVQDSRRGADARETFEDGYIFNCILDAAYRSMQTKAWERVEY